MKITLDIQNTENIENLTPEDMLRIREIITALIASGGLTGVKGGQTIIHYDHTGLFQKVELKYFPWIRRK